MPGLIGLGLILLPIMYKLIIYYRSKIQEQKNIEKPAHIEKLENKANYSVLLLRFKKLRDQVLNKLSELKKVKQQQIILVNAYFTILYQYQVALLDIQKNGKTAFIKAENHLHKSVYKLDNKFLKLNKYTNENAKVKNKKRWFFKKKLEEHQNKKEIQKELWLEKRDKLLKLQKSRKFYFIHHLNAEEQEKILAEVTYELSQKSQDPPTVHISKKWFPNSAREQIYLSCKILLLEESTKRIEQELKLLKMKLHRKVSEDIWKTLTIPGEFIEDDERSIADSNQSIEDSMQSGDDLDAPETMK
ncbi:hypothetical protein [Candidatus Clavichlamydia salmonicola]|uniref:hypothetical protein n=1 Tax=Candidatus Clavichlamydia salmonicola TaxID=469812 RepID=UPI001890D221|nr:hypothetical protein [Candidatus Clavichlamydia salmonicola]